MDLHIVVSLRGLPGSMYGSYHHWRRRKLEEDWTHARAHNGLCSGGDGPGKSLVRSPGHIVSISLCTLLIKLIWPDFRFRALIHQALWLVLWMNFSLFYPRMWTGLLVVCCLPLVLSILAYRGWSRWLGEGFWTGCVLSLTRRYDQDTWQ